MKFSISLKIAIVIVVIVLVTTIIFSAVMSSTITTKLKEEKINELTGKGAEKMNALNIFLYDKFGDIKIISNSETLKNQKYDYSSKLDYLHQIEKDIKSYVSISVYDTNGVKTLDTRGLLVGVNESKKPFMMAALGGEYYYDKTPVISQSLGIPVFHFSAPIINDEGEITGVVVTRLPVVKIDSILGLDIKDEIEFDLVDESGLIVFSNHDRSAILKQRFPNEDLLNSVSGKKSHSAITNDYVYVVSRQEPFLDYGGSNWTLISGLKLSVAFSAVSEIEKSVAIIAAIIILISIPISYVFSRSISRPILNLKNAANRISRGQLNERINIESNDEIGQLAEAFDNMRYSLKMIIDEYEKRRKETPKQGD